MAQRVLNIQKSQSGNLLSAMYDDETLELTVQFQGGKYIARGVPTTLPDEFEGAPSPTKFYNSNIRNQYVVVKA